MPNRRFEPFRERQAFGALVALVVSLSAVACGSDDDSASSAGGRAGRGGAGGRVGASGAGAEAGAEGPLAGGGGISGRAGAGGTQGGEPETPDEGGSDTGGGHPAGAEGGSDHQMGGTSGGAPGSGGVGGSLAGGMAGEGGEDSSTGGAGGSGVEAVLLGTNGGVFLGLEGDIRIDIPGGALLGDTVFTATRESAFPNLPDGVTLLNGMVYRVTWTGAGFASAAPVDVHLRGASARLRLLSALMTTAIDDPQPKTAVQTCNGSGIGGTTIYPSQSSDGDYGSQYVVISCDSENNGSATPGAGSATVATTTYNPPSTPTLPTILQEPADQTVAADQTAAFAVTVSGRTPLSYQWRRDGQILQGQTNTLYGLIASSTDSGASFDVIVSNSVGRTVSRAARLTVAGCADQQRDGDESDIDCGGSCTPCQDGSICNVGADCASRVCDGVEGTCSTPTCTDGVANGAESGIDCGGTSACQKCELGDGCDTETDCNEHYCAVGQSQKLCAAVPACDSPCGVVTADGLSCGTATDGTDPAGACTLPGSACYAGSCGCAAGLTLCSSCTDTARDRNNCGQCGTVCGWSCAGSACVAAAQVAACGGEGTDGLGMQCVRQQTGEVACWGYGIMGDGNGVELLAKPVFVSGLTDAVEIAIGATHACARRTSGKVVCWGSNDHGQVGDGTTTNRLTPVPVVGLTDAVELSAAASGTCARRAGGSVVCWGNNAFGQIGDNTKTDRSTPTAVSGLSDATSISVGSYSACAVRQAGGVVCWGWNAFGLLGDGTTTQRLTPTPVTGVSTAVQVTVGSGTACARLAAGSAMCWGYNNSGAVGNGVFAQQQLTAVSVLNLLDAVELSAGSDFACARRQTGAVVCWGANRQCRLGDGSGQAQNTPVAVVGLNDAVEISAHLSNAAVCARRTTGEVLCWGGSGQSASCSPALAPAP